MIGKRADLAIINRSFWPVYPVIGEALLRFAELHSDRASVSVVLQDHADIRSSLIENKRGHGVDFYPCKALSRSSSGIATRIFDAVFFMFWVCFVLVRTRPVKVYVSTDPPVLVPFVVMLYSNLFRAEYIYHLQDIHPEATNVVMPINKLVYALLKKIDVITMRQASELLTISDEMAVEIQRRSSTKASINILPNPAVSFDEVDFSLVKKRGFTFCGNAGRLQRIPIVLKSITRYLQEGGDMEFVFAGGGVYSDSIRLLASQYPQQVKYLGIVTAAEAAQVNTDYEWALLPIEDEVTRYAFPSKSSSYVFSGAFVAAVCGEQTSVAQWVKEHNLGLVIKPEVASLSAFFHAVECGEVDTSVFDSNRSDLKRSLEFESFLGGLTKVVMR